ncbi:MAG: hypothetical protein AMJ79_08965 [Phycisphaerae bacterium SM23_30]|nr:MAG: hypothetical protein AMJ79_08965 [Phycisphaerae bacterium SM23_30]
MEQSKTDLALDKVSFQLGMINCFAEMVACGVKQMALSPPLTPAEFEKIKGASEAIVAGFGIKSYLEKTLLVTDLQTGDFTRDKWSILYYENEQALESYLALKAKKQQLESAGRYDENARREISRSFLRLLSYPEEKIEQILSRRKPRDPFILIKD